MKRMYALALLAVFALVSAGCGEAAYEPDTDRAGGVLQLKTAGEGDRQILAYALTPGTTTQASMVMDFDINQKIPRIGKLDVDGPSYEMVMDIEVVDVNLAGDFEIRNTVTDIIVRSDGDPELRGQLSTMLEGLVGLESTTTMTPRGVVLSSETEVPGFADSIVPGVMDDIDSQLAEMSAPFPSQPVGEGAEWTYTSNVTIGGVSTRTITTFRVTEMSGDLIVLELESRDEAGRQEIELPGIPAEASVKLLFTKAESKGETVLDLTSPIPNSSFMATVADQAMEVSVEGETVKIEQHIEATMSMRPS